MVTMESPLHSPLRSPLHSAVVSKWGADAYAVLGFEPELVIDAVENYYRANGSATTFADMVTHARTSNATMVDSDGVLKWAPHNLALNSEDLTQASWIKGNVSATATKIIPNNSATASLFVRLSTSAMTGVPSFANTSYVFDLSDGTLDAVVVGTFDDYSIVSDGDGYKITVEKDGYSFTGTYTADEWGFVGVQFFTSSVYVYAYETSGGSGTGDGASGIHATKLHFYRSDLGGMVNNPDRGDSYVPTTSAAVYMPRRGHYRYNGTSWVLAGALFEPTAATNLLTYSQDFTNAAWTKADLNAALDVVGPDGEANSSATFTSSGTTAYAFASVTTVAGNATASAFVKQGTVSVIWLYWKNSANEGAAYFDLSDQTVQASAGTNQTPANLAVEDLGGFYRVSATWAVGAETANFGMGLSDAKGSISVTSGKTLIVYGAQFEADSVPSSYIPTAGSTATRAAETVTLAAAKLPSSGGMPTALWMQLAGYMTYADNNDVFVYPFRWYASSSEYIQTLVDARGALTGAILFYQTASGSLKQPTGGPIQKTPGINVPFNIASRHGSTFVNGAVNGTALTANTTPVALPALSSTNLSLAFAGGPIIISKFRMGTGDIGDAGIAEAST